jgi:hypothetical protein
MSTHTTARAWQVGDIVRGATHFGHHRAAHSYRGVIREVAPARVIPSGTRITARAYVFDGNECVGFFVLQDDLATLDDPMRQSLGGTVGDEVELIEAAPVAEPDQDPVGALTAPPGVDLAPPPGMTPEARTALADRFAEVSASGHVKVLDPPLSARTAASIVEAALRWHAVGTAPGVTALQQLDVDDALNMAVRAHIAAVTR